jgi:hypothetical protein
MRDLTEDEARRYSKAGFVKFEPYPNRDDNVGRYWTQEELDKAGKRTTMESSDLEYSAGQGSEPLCSPSEK